MARTAPSSAVSAKWISALLGTSLALGTALVLVLVRPDLVGPAYEADDETDLKRAAMRQLVNVASGLWDSFPDPDVGRLMMADVESKELHGVDIATNSFGMRERPYELRKPEGTVRVVILGDSYVMGYGLEVDLLLGRHLERELEERSGADDLAVEVLHLGMGSWNILAECAFLRRQVSLLQPDLVVQVTVPNDLNDCNGVRGFGEWSNFSPQVRGRANGILGHAYARYLGFPRDNWIAWGLDHESRQRFDQSGRAIAQLREEVKALGGKYVHMMRWGVQLPCVEAHMSRFLDEDEKLYLSPEFDENLDYRLTRYDPHWSALGNEIVAEMVYAHIVAADLLPQLDLEPWEQATRRLEEIDAPARLLAQSPLDLDQAAGDYKIHPKIVPTRLSPVTAAQVHGGIEKDGTVAPYASVILNGEGATRLMIAGGCPRRQELAGVLVQIFVEGMRVAQIELEPGQPFSISRTLPEEVVGRPFLNVRFEASDYVYAEDDLRRCMSFVLQRIEVK